MPKTRLPAKKSGPKFLASPRAIQLREEEKQNKNNNTNNNNKGRKRGKIKEKGQNRKKEMRNILQPAVAAGSRTSR